MIYQGFPYHPKGTEFHWIRGFYPKRQLTKLLLEAQKNWCFNGGVHVSGSPFLSNLSVGGIFFSGIPEPLVLLGMFLFQGRGSINCDEKK